MSEPKPVTQRIAVGLIWWSGSLVVGVRPPGKPLAGYYEFPGGKCEADETPDAAVVRECLEETGLTVTVRRLRLLKVHEYEHACVELYFYDCELTDPATVPTVRPPFQWLRLADLLELPFPEGNTELLALLSRELSTPSAGESE